MEDHEHKPIMRWPTSSRPYRAECACGMTISQDHMGGEWYVLKTEGYKSRTAAFSIKPAGDDEDTGEIPAG